MASGVAGLTAVIPSYVPPPTFGGGATAATTPDVSPTQEGEAPTASSQPSGTAFGGAKPGVERQAEAQAQAQAQEQPETITLNDGAQGIYNPQKANYVNYFEQSGVGGYQDILNLIKSLKSGAQNSNQGQPNGGKTNQIDNTPPSDTGAPTQYETSAALTSTGLPAPQAPASPSQVEPTYQGATAPIGMPLATSPSEVEPTYQGQPSPIGGTYGQAVAASGVIGANAVTGTATTFGLSPNTVVNPDGTVNPKYYDSQDPNPTTAFGYNAKDPTLQGVSLPVDVVNQSIGDYAHNPQIYQAIKSGQYKVSITNPDTGQTKIVNIVDVGPAKWTGNAADVTYATQKSLGFSGKNNAILQIIKPDGSTAPINGYQAGTATAYKPPTTVATDTAATETPPTTTAENAPTTETPPPATPTTTEPLEPALPQEDFTGEGGGEGAGPSADLLPAEDSTAGEFKKGGLVKKYQAGGIVSPGSVPEQPPTPSPPMAPPNPQMPFQAQIQPEPANAPKFTELAQPETPPMPSASPAGSPPPQLINALQQGREPVGMEEGGEVLAYAEGGKVPGKGDTDKVPALLVPGEFVLRKEAVKRIGIEKLKKMNHG